MSFIQRLNQDTETHKPLTCALASQNTCLECRGHGFIFEKQGAFGVGKVCPRCVGRCPSCLGRAQFVDAQGKASPCKSPSPKVVADGLTFAQIPGRYVQSSLDRFSNKTSENEKTLAQITSWAETYSPHQEGKKGFIISGDVGIGKTYLLTAIIKRLAIRGVRSRFVDFFQLINLIKNAYNDQKSDQDILEPLIDVEVLMIDELGKGRQTEFELTILDQLIMGRYNQDKIIVASTNYSFVRPAIAVDQQRGSFSDINQSCLEDRVGSRIFSRLQETSEFITFTGKNFRQNNDLSY